MAKLKIEFLRPADYFYNQVDPRRRQELHDARMIREDHYAIANLSEQPIYRVFNPDKFKHDCLSAGSPSYNDDAGVF